MGERVLHLSETYFHLSPSMPRKLSERFLCAAGSVAAGMRREGQLLLDLGPVLGSGK